MEDLFSMVIKTNREDQFKNKTAKSGCATKRRADILDKQKRKRHEELSNFRDLKAVDVDDLTKKPKELLNNREKGMQRYLLLLKWKEEKEIKKKQDKTQIKRPFLVSAVGHNPIGYPAPPPPITRTASASTSHSTHSTKSFAPVNAKFRPQLQFKSDTMSLNATKIGQLKSTIAVPHKEDRKIVTRSMVKGSNKESSVYQKESLKSDLKKTTMLKKDVQISSVKESRQNKENVVAKNIKAATKSSASTTVTCKGRIIKQEPGKKIAVTKEKPPLSEKEKEISEFRNRLETEVTKMLKTANMWEPCLANSQLPEYAQDMIRQSIGQTHLLINKKLKQYKELIDQCEKGAVRAGEGCVTTADLQGFWDMVYMQVVNIADRFNKLEKLQDNNWQMEEEVDKKPKQAVKLPPKLKIVGQSRIKELIQARKQALKASINDNDQTNLMTVASDIQKTPKVLSDKENVRNIRTPTTARKMLMEAGPTSSRKDSPMCKGSPLVMMRVNTMAKSMMPPPDIAHLAEKFDESVNLISFDSPQVRTRASRRASKKSLAPQKDLLCDSFVEQEEVNDAPGTPTLFEFVYKKPQSKKKPAPKETEKRVTRNMRKSLAVKNLYP